MDYFINNKVRPVFMGVGFLVGGRVHLRVLAIWLDSELSIYKFMGDTDLE